MNGLSNRSRLIAFGAVFLLAFVALLPMRVGLGWFGADARNLAARETMGSIWNGRLVEAQLGDAPFGNVDAGLKMLPLLVGRASLDLARSNENPIIFGDFRAVLGLGSGQSSVEDMRGVLPVERIFAPLPVTVIEFEDVTIRFENGQCAEAAGLVRARTGGSRGGIALPHALIGNAECAENGLVLPLSSQSGMEQMNIHIASNGDYRAELQMRPTDEDTRQRLIQAGFSPGANGYALVVQGSF